jgi:hypothetical protein
MPSILDRLQSLQQTAGRLSSVRSSVGDALTVNRERAAVVAKQAFDAYDTWQAARPVLAIAGAAGAAASIYALVKRRKVPEAKPLYALTLALSLGALWASSPLDLMGFTSAPAAPQGPAQAGSTGGGLLAWVDGKRAAYAAEDPAWADKTLNRVRALPLVQQTPLLKTVLG